MADDRDPPAVMPPAKRPDLLHGTALRLYHALAAGRPGLAALRVPALPLWIIVERGEGIPGPGTIINLDDGFAEPRRRRETGSRLECTFERTGVDSIEGVSPQTLRQGSRLQAPGGVEPNIRHAPTENAVDAIMRGMSDKRDCCRH